MDDMVVKTPEDRKHVEDLEETSASIWGYDIRLNPNKCTFGVQAGKFLGFMLTKQGIEANPEKFQEIINMRSPSKVKEVQQLTRCLAALSHFFILCRG